MSELSKEQKIELSEHQIRTAFNDVLEEIKEIELRGGPNNISFLGSFIVRLGFKGD
jgi:nucleoid DNA-binding protein